MTRAESRRPPDDPTAWAALLDQAVEESVRAMAAADDGDWSLPAGDLRWDCRFTVLHIASDFVGYAGQLTAPRADGYNPFDVTLEGEPDPAGLRDVVRATGGMLGCVVRTVAPDTVSWHSYGLAGPCDFAAMGVIEVLVHTEDLSRGLGFSWQPSDELASHVMGRLFADVTVEDDPWTTLLWATGRRATGRRPRRTDWRWANTGR